MAVCSRDDSLWSWVDWDAGGKGALTRWSGINLWTRVFARIPISRRCDSGMAISTNPRMANNEGKPVSLLARGLFGDRAKMLMGDTKLVEEPLAAR